MPFLDVTDILFDPDFADTFDVAQQIETVDSTGMASTQENVTAGVSGVVVPDRVYMKRQADGTYLSASITITTTFLLSAGASGGRNADIVTWAGNRYVVMSIGDYSRFGAGFVTANCEIMPLSPS